MRVEARAKIQFLEGAETQEELHKTQAQLWGIELLESDSTSSSACRLC